MPRKNGPLVNQTQPLFAETEPNNSMSSRPTLAQRKGPGRENLELFTNGEQFSSKTMLEFMEVWNGVMVLPKIVSMKGREFRLHRLMLDNFWRDNWREGIKKIAASRFCRGHNRQGTGQTAWRATVDWFMQEHVLPRILEGVYDDKGKPEILPEDREYTNETIS